MVASAIAKGYSFAKRVCVYVKLYVAVALNDVKNLPNTSFSSLLNSLRIEYAKELLRRKEYNVLEVALECGFGSDRNFYRTFKEFTGYSPKEYISSKFS